MSPASEVLEREARVLSGSVESIEVFGELERRRQLSKEGKTRLLDEEESFARLRSKQHANVIGIALIRLLKSSLKRQETPTFDTLLGLETYTEAKFSLRHFLKATSIRFSNSSKCLSCIRFAMSIPLMAAIRQATVAFVLVGSRFSIQSRILG